MAALTATTTAQRVRVADTWGVLTIQNNGATDVFILPTQDVTAATGIRIAAGATWEDPRGRLVASAMWVVTASGTSDIRFMAV